ncbi:MULTISPECIES: restriction endonuclease subunit S [unclassified Microcoleus]|uniref:restriction endonuclease subunit S n=1 Tax=unclassified Microcoleus TaxID=2642155 RepID=UPI002FD37B12
MQLTVDWKIKMLGEIAEVQSGGTPLKANNEYWSGDIPWYTSGELNETFTKVSKSFITKQGLDRSNAKVFPKGSLLIGMYDTAALKMSILDRDAAFNQAIAGVKANENIDIKFILYAINTGRFKILNQRRGVRQKNLSLAKIKNISLPVPPLLEQKRIVAILDEAFEAIDRAIANTEKNLANARELFESYLNAIFTQKGDGWVEKKLEDICSIKHGFAFKGEFFTAEESDYILLTPGCFYEIGGYRNQGEKTKYYVGEIPDTYILKKGDFILAMTEQAIGLLGSSLIVPESDRFLHNQRLGLVQVTNDFEWYNDFFFHQFNTRFFRAAVQSSASGIKVRHTSPKKLGIISVCFPPTIAEQKVVADNLNELYTETQRLEAIYRQKLAALKELKQSILQKAFTGELTADTPKTAEEEIAA